MVDDKINKYMHGFIEDICNDIGPRESGTEQEELAGNKIEEEMKKFCNEVRQEEYISSPKAFLGGIKYGALLIMCSIVLYWLSVLVDLGLFQINVSFNLIFLVIATILMVITFGYFILEVMKYHETYDFLFKKKQSKNVIGTIYPEGEIKRTIIFSAHHDSAYEFNLFYYLKRFGQITINIGYLGAALVFIGVILKIIFFLLLINLTALFFVFGIIFLFFIPIIILYMYFHSYNSVLGAFDNLSGVAIVLGIGKFLSENKKNKEIYPMHSKVHLISFAGEEAGLRGAKRYVKRHFDELMESETITINMDSIDKKDKEVIIVEKEPGIGAKHDLKVVDSLFKITKDLNVKAKIGSLPFGATDAAVFSKKNLSACTISSLNLKEELVPYYHTREDTPLVVEKEALGQVVKICLEYLKMIDKSE